MGKLTVDNGVGIKSLDLEFSSSDNIGKIKHWVPMGSILEGGTPINEDTGDDEVFTGRVRIEFINGQAREIFTLKT